MESKKLLKSIIKVVIDAWFIFGMGLVILLAYLFPGVAREGGIIKSQYSISYGAVALIFFLSGLSISTKVLIRMASRWRAHLVTQTLSFLITPSIMFGLAEAIRISGNTKIDKYILVGLIITGVTPTTVTSNVVMTRQAHGNDSLSIIEATIGNLLGAFITPALAQLYLSDATGFAYGNPASGGGVTELYARVMKQLGLGLFMPLFVGQVVQNIFPDQVKYTMTKYKLNKLSSLCMLLLMWSTFSTAFFVHAFQIVSKESIILVVFFNVGCYILFTILCFGMARLPTHKWVSRPTDKASKAYKLWHRCIVGFYFDRRDTVAIMLCGAAKTVALGIPLVQAQYGPGSSLLGTVSIPLVLYQGEQILAAQFLIPLMRRWVDSDPELKKSDDVVCGLPPAAGLCPDPLFLAPLGITKTAVEV